jgi:hypothetical protein
MKPLLATLAAAIVLVTPGCGAGASAASPPAHPTVLRIAVVPGFINNRHVRRYHLTCTAPAGNVPDPAAACRALRASPRLLAPMTCRPAADLGVEAVRGRFAGRRVSLHLSGTAPCAARWHALAAALGVRA